MRRIVCCKARSLEYQRGRYDEIMEVRSGSVWPAAQRCAKSNSCLIREPVRLDPLICCHCDKQRRRK